MKTFYAITVVIASMFALTACTTPSPDFLAQHNLPGGVTKEQSQVDGTSYIKVNPGWMPNIGEKIGLFSGSSGMKIGAIRFDDGPMSLIARVDDIVRISRITINIDGEVFSYLAEKISTEINLQSDGYNLTHSLNYFEVPDDIMRRMASDETKMVYIKLITSDGYIEGDFGASCEEAYIDRACIGVRNFLKAVDENGS